MDRTEEYRRQFQAEQARIAARNRKWYLVIGVVAVSIFMIYNAVQGNLEPSTPRQYTPDSHDAFYMAKKLMENQLKAPATAEFAGYADSKVKQVASDVWEVTSFVDSQNGFGALIRTRYKMTMVVDRQTETWKVVTLETEP